MTKANYSFVDVETTGTSPTHDRIIEIGILRVEDGKVVRTFESLINPDCHIPPEITMLTGITGDQLESAPSFYSLKDTIRELLDESIFVAHNAKFDMSFVKSEYKRYEDNFHAKMLCTVKLSRKLFPNFHRHNLDALIERFGFQCELRHRALSDAKILWDFFQVVQEKFPSDLINSLVSDITKTPAIPSLLNQDDINNLPENPGVYIFYDKNNFPLYVGKSINIKDRVLSHFYEYDRASTEMKIFQNVASIETKTTQGELGALLLESDLVKKLKPLYNRKLRSNQSMIALLQNKNKDGYYTVEKESLDNVKLADTYKILAVFRNEKQVKEKLKNLAKEYSLCNKLLGIESTKTRCFGTYIEQCKGACEGKENPLRYNMRFLEAFSHTKIKKWPFKSAITVDEGETKYLINNWRCTKLVDGDDALNLNDDVFDYDVYKILSKFIFSEKTNKSTRKVKLLKNQQEVLTIQDTL